MFIKSLFNWSIWRQDLFLEAGWDFSRKAGGREKETCAVRMLLRIKQSTAAMQMPKFDHSSELTFLFSNRLGHIGVFELVRIPEKTCEWP
jgi:hypothetical protein